MTTKAQQKQYDVESARGVLLTYLQPGDTVRVVNRHTTPSGMGRFLDLYKIQDDDTLRLTWHASKVLDWTYSERWDALKVDGCGMDMGFHTVYTLSRLLFAGEQLRDVVVSGDDYDRRGYWLTSRWL